MGESVKFVGGILVEMCTETPQSQQSIEIKVRVGVRVSSVVSCCNLNGKHSDTGNEPGTCVRTNVPCRIHRG